MLKINKHIEIVRSNKTWLSSMSQDSCDAIFTVLNKKYLKVGVTNVDELSDLDRLVASRPDLVFLGVKYLELGEGLAGDDVEKLWIAQHLDENAIHYTGSGSAAHRLDLNKALAKNQVLSAGLKTPPFYTIKRDSFAIGTELDFPLFVKPADRGGGLGIDSKSVVENLGELKSKVNSIARLYQADALVEEYLSGREFSVAILKEVNSNHYKLMPIELVAPIDSHGRRLLSQSVKQSNVERVLPVNDKLLALKLRNLAIKAFRSLGARDYGRIDIRLDNFGVPHFLEANLIPSLISGYGSFPKACDINAGLGYESMILRIAKLGLGRQANQLDAITSPVAAEPGLTPFDVATNVA